MRLIKLFCIALFTFIGIFTFFSVRSESKNYSENVTLGSNWNFNSSAKKDFANNCARCHGMDGRGQTELGKLYSTPDMTNRNWQKARSGKRMFNSIKNGQGSMPAFGKKLSAAQINGLISYIRSLRK
jgi:cytochrome c553